MPIPLPVIAGVFRCTLNWSHSATGQTMKNVIHIQSLTAGDVASNAYSALNLSVTAGMWGTVSNQAGVDSVDIIALDGHSATQNFPTSRPSKWVGNVADGSYVPQVCCIVKVPTGIRGRNHRGRIFLPFTAELVTSQGKIGTGIVPPMQTQWNTFIATLFAGADPFHLGVASYDRKHSGAGAAFTPVTFPVVETLTATQRRRQPGRKISRH